MVRAPCCEKMGLKKGPWTIEEDQILINYVTKYGHENWRALPRQAGLLRCGKSCRLRWMNYLRPDIKRGNFDREEEETIIELHELLGNRWSAIAAKLPGRTDNEIKNVWHTHLKKKIKHNQTAKEMKPVNQYSYAKTQIGELKDQKPDAVSCSTQVLIPESPPYSGITYASSSSVDHDMLENYFPEMGANFWPDMLPHENPLVTCNLPAAGVDPEVQFQFSPVNIEEFMYSYNLNMVDDGMDFWFNNLMDSQKK